MTSWKTLVGGIVGLIGGILQAIPGPDWLRQLGVVIAGCGVGVLGITARDNDKTSEDVGAVPTVRPSGRA